MDDTLSTHLATVVAAKVRGRIAMGLVPAGAAPAKEVAMQVDANGVLQVAGTLVITPGPPGGALSTGADTAVGVGVTASLVALPANPRSQIVQNTGLAGSLVRIRAVGGVAGTGVLLAYLQTVIYTEGIVRLEAENVGAVAATVAVQWETN